MTRARRSSRSKAGAKFQVGQIKSEQLKSAIRDMFYNGQLQLADEPTDDGHRD